MSDFNDARNSEGDDYVRDAFDNAEEKRHPFYPYTLSELDELPPKKYLIKKVLNKQSLVLIYGESNSGKTFFSMKIACDVLMEREFFGHKARKGNVCYIAAEGVQSIRERFSALLQSGELSHDCGLYVIPAAPDLFGNIDVSDIIEQLKIRGIKPSVIFLDTLARTIGGGDENSSDAMGQYIKNCDTLVKETGATVIVIHHSGKDSGKGPRGHSSLKAAVDSQFCVSNTNGAIEAKIEKQRDGPTGEKFNLKLVSVPIGEDEDGDIIYSCYAKEVGMNYQSRPSNDRSKISYDFLKLFLKDEGKEYEHSKNVFVKAVSLKLWRSKLSEKMDWTGTKSDSRRRAIDRIIEDLEKGGFIGRDKSYIWILDSKDSK